jgi:hypothetical protein
MSCIKEGLFDPVKAGGMQGDHYTHFKLPEKILNPINAMATANLLDIPMTRLEEIINGKQFVDRIYTINDSDVQLFRDYSKENGWYAKYHNSSSDSSPGRS